MKQGDPHHLLLLTVLGKPEGLLFKSHCTYIIVFFFFLLSFFLSSHPLFITVLMYILFSALTALQLARKFQPVSPQRSEQTDGALVGDRALGGLSTPTAIAF